MTIVVQSMVGGIELVQNDLIDKRLGKYVIQAVIGEGGMSVVYLAHDPALERPVAIKVLLPALAGDKASVERFRREAKSAARLDHPNIVKIHDIDQDRGNHFFVMQYLVGQDLAEYIKGCGPLSPEDAVTILVQVAAALDFAHRQGIVHRDIKPANIMVGCDGHVTLTDFGIARAVQESRLTRTGSLMGTADYMSPEQAEGYETDSRSDLYSLGIVAFQMLSGQVPYQATSALAMMHKIVYEPPAPIRTLRPDLPDAVEQIFVKALAKKPEHRYATAGAFVEALQTALGVTSLRPLSVLPRPMQPTPLPKDVSKPPTIIKNPSPEPVTPSQLPVPKLWPWIVAVAGALVVIVVLALSSVSRGMTLPTRVVALTATPSSVSSSTPTLTPTPVPTSGFAHPSGAFRIAYPSAWHPVDTSDASSIGYAFEWWEAFGSEQVWVIVANSRDAAAQMVQRQADWFAQEAQYTLLRDTSSAAGTVLREGRYTDSKHGTVHFRLMARAQGRAVGLVVFAVAEERWTDYAVAAESILSNFTFDEPPATATVTSTSTSTPTGTPTPTMTPVPTRTYTPIPSPTPTFTPRPITVPQPYCPANGKGAYRSPITFKWQGSAGGQAFLVRVFWCPDSGNYVGQYQFVVQSPLLRSNEWPVILPKIQVGHDLIDVAGKVCWTVSVVSGDNEISKSEEWSYYHDQLGGQPQPACP